MIENLKKKVFHLFLGISLKRRLFITYLLLSSLILMLTSVFFYTASKKVLIKRAALSSQQQLSLITSNLGEKIDNISNYAITLSINSNIADVLKENPTVPENTLEHFLVNSELTDQAQRIIGLHKNIYAWDILDTENHWFHSSTTETDQLDSILGPEVLDSLQTNLAFQFLGPFQISGEPTFVALKSITNIDNTKYLGALVLLIRETNISSAFRDLPDSSSRDFYITDENGQILSSSSSGGIYKDFSSYTKISSENYKTLTETDRQFFSVDGTDTLFICKSYPDLNWNVINLIPLESLTLDHMVILHNILPEGAAIPANRGQLALLVWNNAGRPEPAAQPAFADVADADMAKAAQWCVEQGIMEAKSADTFKPEGWTPKFNVIETWNKAFPKAA